MATAVIERKWASVAPPKEQSVSEWAESNLVLSERSTGFPGMYRGDRSPYTREPIDSLTDPFVEELTICSAAQIAKTMMLMVMMGYAIDQDPGPMLMVLPNNDLCRSFAEQRLHPLIDDCKALSRHKPKDPKKYRLQEIFFDRMSMALVGSNSPANLASRPVRYLFLDEVDKYPGVSEKEAGAVDLAIKRTRTFWNRKVVKASTPTLTTGEIWRSFLDGDQRYYFVPCPHCGFKQRLVMSGLKFGWCKEESGWDKERARAEAYYECSSCQQKIEQHHKSRMLKAGEWRPTKEPGRHRSYQLSALYPMWVTFGEVAAAWIDAQSGLSQLRDFINSTLGEPWEEAVNAASDNEVLQHRRPYSPKTCPVKPREVIMTADVQDTGIYYLVRAWGSEARSWLVDYGMVADFEALARVSQTPWVCEDCEIMTTRGVIDSGYRTDEVYKFCQAANWLPWKGHDRSQQDIPVRTMNGILHGNVDYFKEQLQFLIRSTLEGPHSWYLHQNTGMDYAMQITAEGRVEEINKWGKSKLIWKKLRRDNHILDLEVMQLAAAEAFGLRAIGVQDQNRKASVAFSRKDGRGWLER